MLDIKRIREDTVAVEKGLKARGVPPEKLHTFLELDLRWRDHVKNVDDARAQLNKLSQKIGRGGSDELKKEAKLAKERMKSLEDEMRSVEAERDELLLRLPNIPFPDVPIGKDETGNKALREVGKRPQFKSQPKDYLTLGKELDLIDVERAGKVAGSRFGYLKNEAALLEFALIQFAFNTLRKEGFIPIVPPVMVKPEMMEGMGKIKFIEDDDAFFLEKDNIYLAGSAEHTIGPMHADEVFDEKDLPRRYVGFSTCFRREAGSYGKDTKGILRVHQFDKVEMFSFTTPEKSEEEHRFLVSLQEKMMQKLKLPYRVVEICTGDMGFGDARQFDIETWIPSENRYRETQSASNTTDYQARGLNIKYKSSVVGRQSSVNYVHMLNATAFAIGRTLIAIIENYQRADGTIALPAVLRKYCGMKKISR